MGKTSFSRAWLTRYAWLKECKGDKTKAYCSLCFKMFGLGTMGEHALRSHMKSETHKRNERSSAGSQFVKVKAGSETKCSETDNKFPEMCIAPPDDKTKTNTSLPRKQGTIMIAHANDDVLKSEILWTLKTVSDHSSYRSNETASSVFKVMFPDSDIASKFACGERKTAYLSVFGLAPYFVEAMKKNIKGNYTVLFDESLNKKNQMKQMDIHIRYWTEENKVVTSYFTSEFVGHATASQLLDHFQSGVLESGLDVKKMQQISMDGPNVNWSFHKLMQKYLADNYDWSLINIGSCGLHTVHNSFKAGASATGWEVDNFLSGLYYLVKDAPARKEDFADICTSSLMPLKFANHRWLENVPVCTRALMLMSDIEAFVKAVDEKKKTKPSCKSYDRVSSGAKDKLFRAKLHFFKFVAGHLQPFLTVFQTDRPMVPFLGHDLSSVIRGLLRCFIEPEKLSLSDDKLSAVLPDKESRLNYKKIEIGFQTELQVKEAVKKGVSERQVMEFKMECLKFLEGVVKKLLEKSPITYSLVRNLSCFSPQAMVQEEDVCRAKFKKVLASLVNSNRIKEDDCDEVIQQYGAFLDHIPGFGSDKFAHFNHRIECNRLDELFTTYMSDDSFSKLLEIVKIILVLSHGQASVERGFSVNKEIEVENMKETTLVAHRIICDNVKAVGGVLNIPITQPLLKSCRMARQRYEQFLDKQRTEKKNEEEQRKRKVRIDELDELKKKKQRIEVDISTLTKSADEYAEKAERCGNLTFITQSNSFRRTAKDKTQELKAVEDKMNTKLEELKTLSVK